MIHSPGLPSHLPEELRTKLYRLSESLQACLGEHLLSLILYGDLVKEHLTPDFSRCDLLLILKQAHIDKLGPLGSLIRQAARDLRVSVMIMTPQDLQRSCDVFPIKFLDMQHHHSLLWGEPLLEKLEISSDHLRLRCEQELKNLLLRLRSYFVLHEPFSELLEATLRSKITPFEINLGVLLTLKGHQSPPHTLLETAAHHFGIELTVLKDLQALKRGQLSLVGEPLKTLYGHFLQVLEQTAQIADELEVG